MFLYAVSSVSAGDAVLSLQRGIDKIGENGYLSKRDDLEIHFGKSEKGFGSEAPLYYAYTLLDGLLSPKIVIKKEVADVVFGRTSEKEEGGVDDE